MFGTPPSGVAQVFRLLELLCGFPLFTTSSKCHCQFTNCGVVQNTHNFALPEFLARIVSTESEIEEFRRLGLI